MLAVQQNSNPVARAQTRQALADASMALITSVMADPQMNEEFWAWMNADADDVLDCERTRMYNWVLALARHHENVFLQAREGIVDETVFASFGYTNSGVYRSPYFTQHWGRVRDTFSPDYVAAFEAEYRLTP